MQSNTPTNLLRRLLGYQICICIVVLGILAGGCSPTPLFLKSDYENNPVKTIAVLPTVDSRMNSKNPQTGNTKILSLQDKIVKSLAKRDYDVVPPLNLSADITRMQKDESRSSIQSICKTLNTDGVLFSTLNDYGYTFMISYTLDMNLRLYDANGDSLWFHKIDVSSQQWVGCILVGPLIMALAEALTNHDSDAIENYFGSLPRGKGSGMYIMK